MGQLSTARAGDTRRREKRLSSGARSLPGRQQRWGCATSRPWGRTDERGPCKLQLCTVGPAGASSPHGWGQTPACRPLRKHHCLFLKAGKSVFQLQCKHRQTSTLRPATPIWALTSSGEVLIAAEELRGGAAHTEGRSASVIP